MWRARLYELREAVKLASLVTAAGTATVAVAAGGTALVAATTVAHGACFAVGAAGGVAAVLCAIDELKTAYKWTPERIHFEFQDLRAREPGGWIAPRLHQLIDCIAAMAADTDTDTGTGMHRPYYKETRDYLRMKLLHKQPHEASDEDCVARVRWLAQNAKPKQRNDAYVLLYHLLLALDSEATLRAACPDICGKPVDAVHVLVQAASGGTLTQDELKVLRQCCTKQPPATPGVAAA